MQDLTSQVTWRARNVKERDHDHDHDHDRDRDRDDQDPLATQDPPATIADPLPSSPMSISITVLLQACA